MERLIVIAGLEHVSTLPLYPTATRPLELRCQLLADGLI